jgi:hypothetical protein
VAWLVSDIPQEICRLSNKNVRFPTKGRLCRRAAYNKEEAAIISCSVFENASASRVCLVRKSTNRKGKRAPIACAPPNTIDDDAISVTKLRLSGAWLGYLWGTRGSRARSRRSLLEENRSAHARLASPQRANAFTRKALRDFPHAGVRVVRSRSSCARRAMTRARSPTQSDSARSSWRDDMPAAPTFAQRKGAWSRLARPNWRSGEQELSNPTGKTAEPSGSGKRLKEKRNKIMLLRGGPEGIRTPDLRFRKPLLYPAELRDRLATTSTTSRPFEKLQIERRQPCSNPPACRMS